MWVHRKSRDTVVLMPEELRSWYTYQLAGPRLLLLGGTLISQLRVSVLRKRKVNTTATSMEANLFYVRFAIENCILKFKSVPVMI